MPLVGSMHFPGRAFDIQLIPRNTKLHDFPVHSGGQILRLVSIKAHNIARIHFKNDRKRTSSIMKALYRIPMFDFDGAIIVSLHTYFTSPDVLYMTLSNTTRYYA